MKSIAVFCAASVGNQPLYLETAHQVGLAIAQRGLTLVYGGSKIGLMGEVARAALSVGGRVIGVLPHFLSSKEIALEGVKVIMVDTMHERKQKMCDLSDGFLTLPGGFGTLDEFFEMITWAQLQLKKAPNALLNCNGYYDFLLQQMDKMTEEGLLLQKNYDLVLRDENIERLLDKMLAYSKR